MLKVNPTNELYEQLQFAYEFFNEALFENQLPNCMITVQREKNTMGFFSPERWSSLSGEHVHEISINPSYFLSRSLMEVFQTLVHEQCHLWQFVFGSPGRRGYHNEEWAQKMISIGLIPSSTGRSGGDKVGQKMADFPRKNGRFMKACIALVSSGHFIGWVDRSPSKELSEDFAKSYIAQAQQDILAIPLAKIVNNFSFQINPQKKKIKYSCRSCGLNVWGKAGLSLSCNICKVELVDNDV